MQHGLGVSRVLQVVVWGGDEQGRRDGLGRGLVRMADNVVGGNTTAFSPLSLCLFFLSFVFTFFF